MQIDIKTKDSDGNLLFEGQLNRNEVTFLIGYAIQDLLHAGVMFNMTPQDNGDDEDAPSRIELPKGTTLN